MINNAREIIDVSTQEWLSNHSFQKTTVPDTTKESLLDKLLNHGLIPVYTSGCHLCGISGIHACPGPIAR